MTLSPLLSKKTNILMASNIFQLALTSRTNKKSAIMRVIILLFNFRSCARQRSRLGVRGSFGVGGNLGVVPPVPNGCQIHSSVIR